MNGKKAKQLKREARKLRNENPATNDGKVLASTETIYNRLKKAYKEGIVNVTRD